ncbi:MAG: sulfatase [Cyclobacteriaceae bacterium]|nr:sulfatase [Cyclobacteriaceae bacterium]
MNHKSIFFNRFICIFLFLLWVSCSPETGNPEDRPNILFAIADDASYPHMGAYGTDWIRTPAFDRVAREGLLFKNCYTPNAKCAPSRSCILTGRNSWQLEEAANHWPFFPQKFRTYAESLSDNGYFVGYTAKGWGPGVALDSQGNRRQLTGIPFNGIKLDPPADFINTIDYAENFRVFLDSLPENTPFCFWYGSTEPHRSYEWQAGIRKGGKRLDEIDRVPNFWPDNDTVRTDLLDYAYEIEWFDKHLEKMLTLLEERGEFANTLVVVTADNGMPFPRVKGQVYEYSNHLPLAIMWEKGIHNPGREIRDIISFIDFAPTFLELAGINQEESGMQPITGKSFTDIFRADQTGMVCSERNFVLVGKERHDVGRPEDAGYPVRGIIRDGYLYLMNFKPDRWPAGNPETGYLNTDGSPTKTWILNERRFHGSSQYWNLNFGRHPEEELYNIEEDPECMVNLASQSRYAEIKDQMKLELARKLEQQEDPRSIGDGDVFDQYLYSNESDRNFYERYMSGEGAEAGWVNETDFEQEKLD